MKYHTLIMGIKKVIESTPNSLKLLEIGELTPRKLSTLMPVNNIFSRYNFLINTRTDL